MLPLDTATAGRRPPFLFNKTPESAVYVQAQQRLSCPISGAIFIRKVTQKASAAGASTGTGDKKKRAHVPDLSTDAVPKKAARKAKAKSKAKAKAQALQFDAETTQDLQGCIDFQVGCHEQDQMQSAKETDAEGHGQGSRQRLWLDDMLSAVERCLTGPYAFFKKLPATKTMRAVVISLALEFACSGTVVLRKKPLKVWSQAIKSMQCPCLPLCLSVDCWSLPCELPNLTLRSVRLCRTCSWLPSRTASSSKQCPVESTCSRFCRR